jgi:hypothetical protein
MFLANCIKNGGFSREEFEMKFSHNPIVGSPRKYRAKAWSFSRANGAEGTRPGQRPGCRGYWRHLPLVRVH